MPSKKTTDSPVNIAALDALEPAVLAERQRAVDLAVRHSREAGYCETVEEFLGVVYPEFGVTTPGRSGYGTRVRFYASDGVDCRRNTFSQLVAGTYGDDGYDAQGYDRDGWGAAWDRTGSKRRPGRPATEAEAAAEAELAAGWVNPTTYKATAA